MKNCALLLILSLCVIALGADTPHERYTPVQPGGHVSQGGHVTGGELGGDEVVTVSLEEWDAVTSQVVKQNDFLIKDILSRQCSITVDFEGNATIKMNLNPPVENEKNFPGTICEVHKGSDSQKPAIVTMVDKISYLHTKEAWYGFINKAYYAVQNDRSFYIWIGKLPKESRPTFQADRDTVNIRWFKCGEKRGPLDGVHALKLLAILAIFEMPNPPQKVLYLDSDMFLPFKTEYKPFLAIEKNFDDPSVFMVGNIGGNEHKTRLKLMNAGYIGAKNLEISKKFLGLWWQSQCGLHDQLPLYLTMMAYYSSISTNFTFSVDHLKLYHYGRNLKGALPYYFVKDRINNIRQGPLCENSLRKPTNPEGFTPRGRLLVNDPLCGIVTTHVKQNGFCHCHLSQRQCKGRCANIWPPPYEGAPLGSGTEIEEPLAFYFPGE